MPFRSPRSSLPDVPLPGPYLPTYSFSGCQPRRASSSPVTGFLSLLLFQLRLRSRDMAHLGAPLRVLPDAAHFSPVAFEAGLMVSRLEPRAADVRVLGGWGVAIPAGLERSGVDALFENGGIEPMAFRARLDLHRSMLVVAVRATRRHGDVPGMVEYHRFVDAGQAAQSENLRNVSPRVRFACNRDPDPEDNGNQDDRRFLHGSGSFSFAFSLACLSAFSFFFSFFPPR